MQRLQMMVMPLLLAGLLAGCSGEKAEEPKNPVPKPTKGPSGVRPGGGQGKDASQPAPPPPPRR